MMKICVPFKEIKSLIPYIHVNFSVHELSIVPFIPTHADHSQINEMLANLNSHIKHGVRLSHILQLSATFCKFLQDLTPNCV
jgi:hypothetical protein